MNLGGTEKSFLNLLHKLDDKYTVDLLLLEKNGDLLDFLPANVNILTLDNEELINQYIKLGCRKFGLEQLKLMRFILFIKCMLQFTFDKLGFSRNPYWAISNYVKPIKEKYEVSVAYAGIHNFIAHYVLTKTQAKKKILWIHFDVSKVINSTFFGNYFYNKFNTIFCVSKNSREVFLQMFPKVKNITEVFENIVSEKLIKESALIGKTYNDDFKGLRIITLGRLSFEKGQDMIPEVVFRLKKEGLHFRWYLIGDGKLTQNIQEQIKKFKLEENLILLGSNKNPYAYLRDCDLFVQTSRHEGYCLTLHEAKVFNKPVVTTNFLSASNLIKDKEDGLIVDISVDGIFEGVKQIIDNKELRNKFSKTILIEEYSQKIEL